MFLPFSQFDWRAFHDRIGHETHAEGVRNIVFAWLVGLTYWGVGESHWQGWMDDYDLPWRALYTLLALIVCPVLLWGCSRFSRKLGNWPRCPACGGQLYALLPTIASKRCPHCNTTILSDFRSLAPGYELPLTPREIMEKKPGYPPCSFDENGLQSARTVFVVAPLVVAVFFMLGLKRNMDVDDMLCKTISALGGGVIALSGIAPLLSIRFMLSWLHRLRLMPKNQSAYCPACGTIPEYRTARQSGCCSGCGIQLLNLPDEPDTPEMVDWHKFKDLMNWRKYYGIGATFAAFSILFLVKKHTISAIFFFVFLVIVDLFISGKLRRRAGVATRCPHCAFPLERSYWSILRFGRCPNCSRRLVRSQDE